jgi:response regulator RpfG family c-di-GMP phosphodiesterase
MKAAVTPARVPVLVVSPYPDDHFQLGKMLPLDQWELYHAMTCEQAQGILENTPCRIVISEAKLAGKCWRKMLAAIRRLPEPRQPRLVVVSRHADDCLWSEVLNLGGHNVLAKPFDRTEVHWVLQ